MGTSTGSYVLNELCEKYLRPPLTKHWLPGDADLTFSPPLSAPEQVIFNDLKLMAKAGSNLTLAEWQAGAWSPPPNSPLGKLAMNVNADGTVKAAAVPPVTPAAHVHPESDVTNLVNDLAGKAATAHVHAPVHTVLANDTLALALATNTSVRLTVTAARTLTTTVPAAGSTRVVLILTSGASSFVITFGAGFKPVSTLATGATAARVFAISFISDGTNLYETGRTAAMVA